jgi:hypothetical protein
MSGEPIEAEEETEAEQAFIQAPNLGEQVLPADCKYSAVELRSRIEQDVPAESAVEYLARVALEAEAIPAIVSSTISQESHRPKAKRARRGSGKWTVPEAVPALKALEQSKQQAINENFEHCRALLLSFEEAFVADESKRKRLIKVDFPRSLERIQWMEFIQETAPLMHVLLQLDNNGVIRGLRHLTKQIEQDARVDDTRASWLFALLSRLDVPFTDDVATTLKRLIRLLILPSEEPSANSGELDPRSLIRFILQDSFRLSDGLNS